MIIFALVLVGIFAGLWIWVLKINDRLAKQNRDLLDTSRKRIVKYLEDNSFWDSPCAKRCLCIPEDIWNNITGQQSATLPNRAEGHNGSSN